MDKHHIYKTWADTTAIEFNKSVQLQWPVILHETGGWKCSRK